MPLRPPRLPVEPQDYVRFWRAPGIPLWKPILAAVVGAIGFLVISLIVVLVPLVVQIAADPGSLESAMTSLARGEITPELFVANSVALALMVPLSMLLGVIVGQRPGYMSSVVGRIRWGWLLFSLLPAVIVMAGFLLVSQTLEGWDQLDLHAARGSWLFLAALMLITPFQAAGEEYLVRGVLSRAVAAIIPVRWLALLLSASVSSLVFMFLHGAGDPWLNIVYFTMGLLFWHVTWRTGGLEVAIALHVANNMLALALVPFMDLNEVMSRQAGVGSPALLIQVLVLGVAAAWLERRARLDKLIVAAAPALRPPVEVPAGHH